jgi:hypothetical protein
MKRARALVPTWAAQLVVGLVVVLVAVGVFAAVVGSVARGPAAFFEEVGRTVSRVIPQARADIRSDGELKTVIAAMPDAKLRVATIVDDQDRVVFTVTADRRAVRAVVRPGDELRIGRDGNVEVAPTGIPGLLDQLQRELEKLFRR